MISCSFISFSRGSCNDSGFPIPSLPRFPPSSPRDKVDAAVDQKNDGAEEVLGFYVKIGGVEKRQDVVFDEAGLVGASTGEVAEMVFQRSERADTPGEFDEGAPEGGGKVNPGDARPPQDEEASGDDEGDEEKVDEDNCVGKQAIHAASFTPASAAGGKHFRQRSGVFDGKVCQMGPPELCRLIYVDRCRPCGLSGFEVEEIIACHHHFTGWNLPCLRQAQQPFRIGLWGGFVSADNGIGTEILRNADAGESLNCYVAGIAGEDADGGAAVPQYLHKVADTMGGSCTGADFFFYFIENLPQPRSLLLRPAVDEAEDVIFRRNTESFPYGNKVVSGDGERAIEVENPMRSCEDGIFSVHTPTIPVSETAVHPSPSHNAGSCRKYSARTA